MRRHIYASFTAIIAIVVMLSTSCSKNIDGIEIGTNGIGDIRFGEKISDLPKQSRGLYDNIVIEKAGEAGFDEHTLYTFTLDGLPIAKIEDYGQDGIVSSIQLVSPIAQINGISTGMRAKDLLKKENLEQVFYNDGSFFFKTEECLISINEFSQSGDNKLQQAYSTGDGVILTENDFTDNSVVKSIICQAGDVTNTYSESSSKNTDWGNTIGLIILIAIYIAMGMHMYKVNTSEKREKRVFTGSKWRMFFFAVLMSTSFIAGVNAVALMSVFIVTPIVLCIYYYACLTPMSIIVKNGYSKNCFHFIGGLWANFENRKRNDALIKHLEQRRDEVSREMSINNSDKYAQELDSEINSLNSRINEEKYGMGEDFMKIILTVVITTIFAWLTPFSAIGSYLKNYFFYGRKKKTEVQP